MRSGRGLLLALVVSGVLVVGLLVLAQRPSLLSSALPGVDDCTVDVDGTEVGLSTAQAERAADVAARSVRLSLPRRTTTTALVGELDLSRDEAAAVAAALKGASPGGLTCLHGGATSADSTDLDDRGLTARAATLRRELLAAYGDLPLGGFAPGGVDSGHMPGSAHYDGRAVDVFFRPVDEPNLRRGWAVAQWLVAHADRLGVETVIYDRKIWTARRAVQGWRDYTPDTSDRPAEVVEVLEHRDHVHVDVSA
ncbi:hypothetical protein [Nocardioides marmoraquaticus]